MTSADESGCARLLTMRNTLDLTPDETEAIALHDGRVCRWREARAREQIRRIAESFRGSEVL